MSYNTNYTQTYSEVRAFIIKAKSILALYGPYTIYSEVRSFIRLALRGAVVKEVVKEVSSQCGAKPSVMLQHLGGARRYGDSGPHCRIKLAFHVKHTYRITACVVG